MNEAQQESNIVRLLEGGPINAVVFNDEEMQAVNRLVDRGQVKKDYNTPAGFFLGVPHIELVR